MTQCRRNKGIYAKSLVALALEVSKNKEVSFTDMIYNVCPAFSIHVVLVLFIQV